MSYAHPVEIIRLDRSRLDEASEVLARAFHEDPAWVWLIPDPVRRARLLPWLFRVGFDVTAADVYATAGELLGAARWLAPGSPSMRVGPTLRALVTTPLRLGAATTHFLSYGRAVELMRAEIAPGDHWYLAGIGVAPEHRNKGVGGALLQPGIEASSAAGFPAVLLTNNEANLAFYEGHGFRVVREGKTPKDGPHAWAMVRRP
jgi:ribosomal protein S18 acetylase RimI-like enzyme